LDAILSGLAEIAAPDDLIRLLLPWSEWEFPSALPAKKDKPFQ
jgi:hypothetical protein